MTHYHKTDNKIPPLQLPLSDSKWIIPLVGYCVYTMFFIAGYFLNLSALNIVGAFLLFFILLVGNYKNMLIISKDSTINIVLLILFIPTVNTLINIKNVEINYLIKHIVIYALYFLILLYKLPALFETKKRIFFQTTILVLLILSIVAGKVFKLGEETRLSGIFVNPNNFSLIGLSLLFFINEDKDTVLKRSFMNFIVILILIIASTSGAILAYIAANAYKYRKKIKKLYILPIILIILIILPHVDLRQFQFTKKVISQFTLIGENYPDAVSGEKLDYGTLAFEHGTASLSGIWRLALWARALDIIKKYSVVKLTFGNGVGSSRQLLGNLPHNEYLRIFLEQGLIGFILSLVFYFVIYFRIDSRYRYLLLMFAIFSFTENNIDNMLFMSLFIYFIATAQINYKRRILLCNCS